MTIPRSPIPGFKLALMGGSGHGKTHAIRTLADAGITPFILFTEQGMDRFGGPYTDLVRWHYERPANVPWDVLAKTASNINTFSFKALKTMQDPNRQNYDQFVKILESCNDFVDDRSGEHYGDISTWGTDRAFVIDSWTGVSKMAMQLTVGGKASPDPGEWGTAMSQLEDMIIGLCNRLHCHLVIIFHVEREMNEATGESLLMLSTLGRKLAPKLAPHFTDIVQAKRVGTNFTWTTIDPDVDTKARNLPWGKDLPADFSTVIEGWKANGGVIEKEEQPTTETVTTQ